MTKAEGTLLWIRNLIGSEHPNDWTDETCQLVLTRIERALPDEFVPPDEDDTTPEAFTGDDGNGPL